MDKNTCLLCCEEKEIFTVGLCNHNSVCLECAYKLRSIQKNTKCTICNTDLQTIIATKNQNMIFDELEQKFDLKLFSNGIYYADEESKKQCFALDFIQCVYPKCNKKFQTVQFLKKHMQEAHKRFFCDLCLQNRALLISEQQTFRKNDLSQHLTQGDHDEEGNLIFYHPFCSFCDRHFFNEEQILEHLKKAHLKCDICKTADQKFVFYNKQDNLITHYKLSHYVCPIQNCIYNSSCAFCTQEELDKHFNQLHNVSQSSSNSKKIKIVNLDNFEAREKRTDSVTLIKDKEGQDFSQQLMSQMKITKQINNQEDQKEIYQSKIDNLILMDILQITKFYGFEEEQQIYSKYLDEYKKGDQTDDQKIYFEDIKFKKEDHRQFVPYTKYEEQVCQLIYQEKDQDYHSKITRKFLKNQISSGELFEEFKYIFGPILCYKYYYLYSKTLKGRQRELIMLHLQNKLGRVSFRNGNLIAKCEKWKDFFNKMSDAVGVKLFQKIEQKQIDLEKKYLFGAKRMFQIAGSIRTLTVRDFLNFKYLVNFMQQQDSVKHLFKSLICPSNRTMDVLEKIPTIDLLTIFTYLNLAIASFQSETKTKNIEKINPNLLKIFLRHYPQLAEQKNYELFSDEEDYEEIEGKQQNQELQIQTRIRNQVGGQSKQTLEQQTQKFEKLNQQKTNAFQLEFQKSNTDNIEFPNLPGYKQNKNNVQNPIIEYKVQQTGWGSDNPVFNASNEAKSRYIQDDFPLLVQPKETGKNVLQKINSQQQQENKPKITMMNYYQQNLQGEQKNQQGNEKSDEQQHEKQNNNEVKKLINKQKEEKNSKIVDFPKLEKHTEVVDRLKEIQKPLEKKGNKNNQTQQKVNEMAKNFGYGENEGGQQGERNILKEIGSKNQETDVVFRVKKKKK